MLFLIEVRVRGWIVAMSLGIRERALGGGSLIMVKWYGSVLLAAGGGEIFGDRR